MSLLALNDPPGDELFWLLMGAFAIAAIGINVIR